MRPDPSGAEQADDLAGPHRKIDRAEARARKPLQRQDGLAGADIVADGMGDRCARDRGDDIRRIEIGDVLACERDLAVAQYGDAIGDLEHFLQAMRDVDDMQPLAAKFAQTVEDDLRLGLG